MKRFAIFEFGHYYPNGGMEDYKTSFDTLVEAVSYIENQMGLSGDRLKELVKDCSYSCQVWDMVEIKKVWDMYGID